MRRETMRRTSGSMAARIMGLLLCTLGVSMPGMADTYWNIGVSGGRSGLDGFHLSIGEYYQVPQREVVVIHKRGIYVEELPVVFYLAQRARVYPGYIVDLRHRGMSWMDITLFLGLHPDIYYVPVVVARYGPPFGPAYGYYHHHPRGGWKRHDLRDRDIINQVNLRFMSEHYRYAPEKIMRYRAEGRSFHDIDRSIRGDKGRIMTRNANAAIRNDYRDSRDRRTMTGTEQQVRYKTGPEQSRQYITRQSQPVRSLAGPDDWGKQTSRQGQRTSDMTRQNQKVRTVAVPDESKQSAAKQPNQLRHMARRDF